MHKIPQHTYKIFTQPRCLTVSNIENEKTIIEKISTHQTKQHRLTVNNQALRC